MNAIDLVRHEMRSSYTWLEAIVGDVSPAQSAWRPEGTANSIAATYAHTMIWADVDLHRHFHGRAPLLAGDWGQRLGRREDDPEEWETGDAIDWRELRSYGVAVQRAVGELVASLTLDDLARKFQMHPPELGTWRGIDVYSLHVGRHIWMHGGEIACLKGLQGAQGYGRAMTLYP
jgi:hypothetical protein